ncbi:uncharacterized protein BHQ10_000395 [Talaromyces amestolkiae]|uniref:Glycogen debranching enzyme C-terminal domain-containing protein n=1 Tax=Talaromyces amestolkiae TaxID=1196081 RepID=A0A364KLG9_TALAM|nr:uncharacterized protein BHQ10_000395 [Talaromyces amestolkiae]RAO64383.1 hypothetical protein BHQ10_000395 [Talaromyces amestolkiae]
MWWHLLPLSILAALGAAAAPSCSSAPSTLHLPDAPYDNFFYSDCNTAAQVVVTTPQPDSNLSLISPRLVIAWPAGNSGVCTYFAPQNGVNGSLSIEVVNSTVGNPLAATYDDSNPTSGNDTTPFYGVTGTIRFNSSAVLTVPILGSIRTIRDFVEGPSLLQPQIQGAINASSLSNGGALLERLWLDNMTSTYLNFTPTSTNSTVTVGKNNTLTFEAGDYIFTAKFNYPQLKQLSPAQVLTNASTDLIKQDSERTSALSFLSYSTKLLAGAWRFLTYFGRDSMISALLLEPILSKGENGAMEAVIAAVLERINRTDGSVCHEETIGDYATWLNEEQYGLYSTEAQCDYKMVDSDFYLPVLMNKYFVEDSVGRTRAGAFLNTSAGAFNTSNGDLTYQQMAAINAERIMKLAAPFAGHKNQTKDNLVHLKDGQIVGEWRDSTYGIGGGRIPYDVNTALMPAALRAIASLARNNFFANQTHWAKLADRYAQVWEDETLSFFRVTVSESDAKQLVTSYAQTIDFAGPNQTDTIDGDVTYHALALDGNNNQSQVLVMNTDDCFRHFLLNTTRNQDQLTAFINQTANNIRRTFPAGLLTDAGLIVANPAYGQDPVYASNWTSGAYHGTVIWSWPLAMMAKGLEQQLGRCETVNSSISHSQHTRIRIPNFCKDATVYDNVKAAYNTLWDSIEANQAQLSQEVWSWTYDSSNDTFVPTPLGVMPPPPGTSSQTGMLSFHLYMVNIDTDYGAC